MKKNGVTPIMFSKRLFFACSIVAALAACGCDDEQDGGTGPVDNDFDRQFVQIERLGNPLVSEVTFEKRNHGHHNASAPSTDVANFTDDLEGFVANVAGRSTTVQTTLSAVLLPDMLIVESGRDPGTSGWLSWALANGWGGRNLPDDVVDAGLAAIFGNLLSPDNVTACLSTDNVDNNDAVFASTFPYLAAPH